MNDPIVSIITPVYNRAELLKNCFSSLTRQTSKNFEWIIIDDGSTDNSFDVAKSFKADFRITCVTKENGGKHTALNESHKYVNGKYILILDSDDTLIDYAVETVIDWWIEFENHPEIGVISFYKRIKDGKITSKKLNSDFIISDHISFRVNKKSGGDQCETVRTKYFKEYVFPIYDGEKFASEGLLWNYLGYRYKTVYVDKAIYVCEYLDGGLSRSGRKMLMSNPKAMIDLAKTFFDKRVCTKIRFKQTWLYIVYSLCDKRNISKIIDKSEQPFFTLINIPVGFVLYLYWKGKYR